MAGYGGGIARLLGKHRKTLVREINADQVIPYLVRNGIIDYSEDRDLYMTQTPKQRAELLIDILAKKGGQGFRELCSALEVQNPRLLSTLLVDLTGRSCIYCRVWLRVTIIN